MVESRNWSKDESRVGLFPRLEDLSDVAGNSDDSLSVSSSCSHPVKCAYSHQLFVY